MTESPQPDSQEPLPESTKGLIVSKFSDEPIKEGKGKVLAGFITPIVSTYILAHMEKDGIDLKAMGLSSDIVKCLIEGSVTGFVCWFTPHNLVSLVKEAIVFVRVSIKEWSDAWKNPLP